MKRSRLSANPRFWLPVAVLSLQIASVTFAIDANPNPVILTQPDGSEITLALKGNEFENWYEDTAGYSVLRENSGTFVYAVENGRLANPSASVVGKDAPPPGALRGIAPRTSDIEPPAHFEANDELTGRIAARGKVKNLVVPLRFGNHKERRLPASADYDKIFNAVGGDTKLAPTGSVRDIYLENSYGQFELNSDVIDWVDVPGTEAYYADQNSGMSAKIWDALRAALDQADRTVDFSQYDQDHDGWVDAIAFIHSGYGAENGGDDSSGTPYKSRIWSHRWTMPTWKSKEGIKVGPYHINPGLWGNSGTSPTRIGVICHETGHFFGLPDLYDTSKGSQKGEGIGSWCLMSNSWGFDGSQLHPPHFSAWSKIYLGWLDYTDINSPGEYVVPQAETKTADGKLPTVFRITKGYPSGEYLLIENRQPAGSEIDMPKGGLAIWHIDMAKADNTQAGFPGQAGWPGNDRHYRVALLQADGKYDLEKGVNRGDGGDTFVKSGTSVVNDETVPNLRSYRGGAQKVTGNQISVTTSAGKIMKFVYSTDGPRVASDAYSERIVALDEYAQNLAKGDPEVYAKAMTLLVNRAITVDTVKSPVRDEMFERMLKIGNPRVLIGNFGAVSKNPLGSFGAAVNNPLDLTLAEGDQESLLLNSASWRANFDRLLSKPERIYGARPANEGELPHCVAVGNEFGFCCSGTLIAPDIVLTAAHCLRGGCASRVFFGLNANIADPAFVVKVKHKIPHEAFDPVTFQNDIAILILERPVDNISVCKIASADDTDNAWALQIAGFGYTENRTFGIQMTADIAVACAKCDPRECVVFGSNPELEIVGGGNGVDTCNGDSGGPAYLALPGGELALVGITSRATRNRTRPCGDGGIYTRPEKYLDWINLKAREIGSAGIQ